MFDGLIGLYFTHVENNTESDLRIFVYDPHDVFIEQHLVDFVEQVVLDYFVAEFVDDILPDERVRVPEQLDQVGLDVEQQVGVGTRVFDQFAGGRRYLSPHLCVLVLARRELLSHQLREVFQDDVVRLAGYLPNQHATLAPPVSHLTVHFVRK